MCTIYYIAHRSCSAAEAEDMLWELDDNARRDGLDWKEFAFSYLRAKNDDNFTTPRRLYFFILYKMIDIDGDGDIRVDEMYNFLAHLMGFQRANKLMQAIMGKKATGDKRGNIEDEGTVRMVRARDFCRIMSSNLGAFQSISRGAAGKLESDEWGFNFGEFFKQSNAAQVRKNAEEERLKLIAIQKLQTGPEMPPAGLTKSARRHREMVHNTIIIIYIHDHDYNLLHASFLAYIA